MDVISLERTHEYRGLYHVLGGSLSPLDGVEPEHLRIGELLRRVAGGEITEVVLATNPNMTGEATAAYLADKLRDGVTVTRLASRRCRWAATSDMPTRSPSAEHSRGVARSRTVSGPHGPVIPLIGRRLLR